MIGWGFHCVEPVLPAQWTNIQRIYNYDLNAFWTSLPYNRFRSVQKLRWRKTKWSTTRYVLMNLYQRIGPGPSSIHYMMSLPVLCIYPRDQPTIILLCSRLKVSLIIRNGWGWGRAPLDAFPSMSGWVHPEHPRPNGMVSAAQAHSSPRDAALPALRIGAMSCSSTCALQFKARSSGLVAEWWRITEGDDISVRLLCLLMPAGQADLPWVRTLAIRHTINRSHAIMTSGIY